jgi:hypothetical protein
MMDLIFLLNKNSQFLLYVTAPYRSTVKASMAFMVGHLAGTISFINAKCDHTGARLLAVIIPLHSTQVRVQGMSRFRIGEMENAPLNNQPL